MTPEAHPIAGACGAELLGIDLTQGRDADIDFIRDSLNEYGVVFLRDQHIDIDTQIAFAQNFGALEVHPIVDGLETQPEVTKVLKPANESASFGTGWHSDNSFFAKPSMGSVLLGKKIPPYGGDTLFACQYRAYETLSDEMKKMLDGKRAIHSAREAYTVDGTAEKFDKKTAITYRWSNAVTDEVAHPVIRTHPATGRKALYVNQMFTLRFDGMSAAESEPLLTYLYEHATRPDFTCRFRWTPDAIAFWDNARVQHYALDDYFAFERLMYRVTIEGDTPA